MNYPCTPGGCVCIAVCKHAVQCCQARWERCQAADKRYRVIADWVVVLLFVSLFSWVAFEHFRVLPMMVVGVLEALVIICLCKMHTVRYFGSLPEDDNMRTMLENTRDFEGANRRVKAWLYRGIVALIMTWGCIAAISVTVDNSLPPVCEMQDSRDTP